MSRSLLAHRRRGRVLHVAPVDPPGPDPDPDPDPPIDGPTQTITYTADTTTDFLNPERAWHDTGFDSGKFGSQRNNGRTLFRMTARLDAYRNSALTSNWLNTHRNQFQAARNAGIKICLRYAYNWPNLDPGNADASLSRILGHIDQLAPVWEEYFDVIAELQAGFVGEWGEWHSSTNGHTSRNPSNRNAIIRALLDALPNTRMISFRYPEQAVEFLGGTVAPVNIPDTTSPSEAFTGTDRSRLGLLNDSFLRNPTDGGTYVIDRWAGNWGNDRYAPSYNFWIAQSRYSVASGETVSTTPWGWNYEAGPDAIAEMTRLNWDILNHVYNTDVINGWRNSGHYNEISRRLGYRLALLSATLPTHITPNQPFQVQLSMRNDGFGKVYNPRPIDLYLVPSSGAAIRIRLTSDARRDLPLGGQTRTLTYTATAPSLAIGTYAMHLALPDPTTALANDARYSIRLATNGIWLSSSGRNNLNAAVSVT